MRNPKVLLVDDEADFVTALAERLQLRKINATIATSGEMALEMIETDRPDVVILDIKMPGLGGLEVLHQIKGKDKSIQVILLTGHGSTREGIEGMRLGAYDFLMKPIDIDELINKMKELPELK
ncbi:response regulator [bacterium]|nr:response regulator [bacterium]